MTVASFIAAQRTEHGVPHAKCCRWLGVSQSWFYKWNQRPATAGQLRRAELDAAVKASFDDSGGIPHTYGSPRVFEGLVAAGWRYRRRPWPPQWPVRVWWVGLRKANVVA